MHTHLTISDIQKGIENGAFSTRDVVSSCLSRVEQENEKLNALLGVSETALEEAEAIDQKRAKGEELGALAGIPVVVKDNILVEGWKATAGSKILENYTAAYSSTVVDRLRNAGAIVIGRANMDEFAMGSSTETSHFGTTQNPWDLTKVPGGSSGGSAAAVAAGFAPIALGTDTGGSVRQPASLCGLVGLKPTYGRVSRYGVIAMASSLDQVSPFSRSVEDAARVLQVIEGNDPRDATSAHLKDTTIAQLLEQDVKGLRIGLPKEYFAEGLDPHVKQAVMDAVGVLEGAGARVVDVSLPHTKYGLATYYIIMPAEASSNLGRYDGMRYGDSSAGNSLTGTYEKTRAEGFGEEVKRRIMLGAYTLSAGYYDAYYRSAMKMRTQITRDFDEAFKDCDVIATPTSPTIAWNLGQKMNDPLTMYLSDIYTISANLSSIPAMSIPCGFSEGLPIGLQLMAKSFDEHTLFKAGHTYQQLTDWHTKTP